jgi:hypothetical protein
MRVFGYEIVEILQKAGLVLKHMLGVALIAWRRMVRAGLISWGIGFILVEIVGALTAHPFSGSGLAITSVVAVIFACVVAYSVMLTVLIDEIIIGAITTVKVVEGDVRAGARALAVATERKAGEAGSGIMRWLGHPSADRGEQVASYSQARETQDAIDATDEFSSTMPRPRVHARPVSADQLPRITWAMEQVEPVEHAEAPANSAPLPENDTSLPASPVASTRADTSPAPVTRPLSTSQPLAEGERSIWSRISKTLVGNVHPPLADEQAIDSTAGAGTGEDGAAH